MRGPDHVPNLDRYLDPEQHARATRTVRRWVWCRRCHQDDADANQRQCRRCGASALERHGPR